MDAPLTGTATNRRNFLTLMGLGAGAVAGGGLLAGCSEEVGRGSGQAAGVNANSGVLPKYKELGLDLPAADIKGVPPISDAYSTYPKSLVDAVAEAPGKSGQRIRAMAPAWGPAPPALAKNSFAQSVNKELGIDVEFSVQDGLAYADKLNAMFGARDVPDMVPIPNWEVSKIPRFSQAINTLFEDLTPFLAGDAAAAYPNLASLPTSQWQQCVWDGKLRAIPNPGGASFPWALFYRKDLFDKAGLAAPTTVEEFHAVAKRITDKTKGIWAFGDVFAMIQMYYKVPNGVQQGWRLKPDGTPEHRLETQEYRQALEFTAKMYKEGLVHPTLISTAGGDMKQLFQSGKIWMMQDGLGAWQGMQAEQQKITKGFNIQPVQYLSATGGDPLVWFRDEPISYCFIKKGLPKERVQELLRVSNWLSAPFGSKEFELREYGVEGRHFTRSASGPVKTDLAFKEGTFGFWISGRIPVTQPYPDTPDYPRQVTEFHNKAVPFREKDPWEGLKVEWPSQFSANAVPTDDKLNDIVRGRRPLTDLDKVYQEWRNGGGDQARELLAKALENKGK
ncbi:MAG TPA: extracellular solute-binding protein [Pilimelia sp.]|nr:extracellular solute-binding protein [Pilimelia sp.]